MAIQMEITQSVHNISPFTDNVSPLLNKAYEPERPMVVPAIE